MSLRKLLMLAAGGAAAGLLFTRAQRYSSIRSKHVIITGGARGLGLCLARELIGRGARVSICSRNQVQLQNAERELKARGQTFAQVFAATCDVQDPGDVARFVQDAREALGPIDGLINNAGIISVAPEIDMVRADYEHAMATHLWGPMNMTSAVLPEMRNRRAGRIVNISSIGGKIAVPHLLPYSTSKFALVGYSEGLRAEVMRDGIYVTTVCPGLIRTGSPRNALFKGQNEKEYAWFTTSDTLPILSIDPALLARKIIDAMEAGQAELISPWPARLQATFHGVFPGLTSDLAALANRFLPSPGGVGTRWIRGSDSTSARIPAFARRRTGAAANAHNEGNA